MSQLENGSWDGPALNGLTLSDPPVPAGIGHILESPPNPAKIQIPRLGEGGEPPYKIPKRLHRRHVTRACEQCRQRKTKCTGEESGCRNCKENSVDCHYTEGKRERSKKQFEDLKRKVDDYDKAFRQLSADQGVPQEELLRSLIRKYDAIVDEDEDRAVIKRKKLDETTMHTAEAKGGELQGQEAKHENLQDSVKCNERQDEEGISPASIGNLSGTPSSSTHPTYLSLPLDAQLMYTPSCGFNLENLEADLFTFSQKYVVPSSLSPITLRYP